MSDDHRTRAAAPTRVGISYALDGLERGEPLIEPAGPAIVRQVRRAARGNVSLDVVLRSSVASDSLLEDFILEEAELSSRLLRRILRTLTVCWTA